MSMVQFLVGTGICLSVIMSRLVQESTRPFFADGDRVKRQQHEAGLSSPSHTKVKKAWTSIPMCSHGVVLRHRNNSFHCIKERIFIINCFPWSLE
jgi:hypothetical protein